MGFWWRWLAAVGVVACVCAGAGVVARHLVPVSPHEPSSARRRRQPCAPPVTAHHRAQTKRCVVTFAAVDDCCGDTCGSSDVPAAVCAKPVGRVEFLPHSFGRLQALGTRHLLLFFLLPCLRVLRAPKKPVAVSEADQQAFVAPRCPHLPQVPPLASPTLPCPPLSQPPPTPSRSMLAT